MHIALIEPEIPGNTGSIGRVCVGTGTTLHLVGKLGFSLDERYVRRAGLDYWQHVDLHQHADVAAFLAAMGDRPLHFFSAHGAMRYDQVRYGADDVLVFGGESRGFAAAVHAEFAARMVFIPTNGAIRSLNLANAATAVLYEGLRQQGFPGLHG
jgi:tRNA (cytidine/uridine-2'-O-)-methyltransferase